MNRLFRLRRLVVAALLGWAGATVAQPSGCGEDLVGATRVESARHVIAFATAPAPIPVGRHFVVDIAVCPKGAVSPPAQVAVDATMPEHRHGMNYKPSVTAIGPGRFRAEGLLFHMPGRWEIVFHLPGDGEPALLRQSIQVR